MLICKQKIRKKKKLLLLAVLLTTTISYTQQHETWVFSGEIGFKASNLEYTQGNNTNNETNQINLLAKVGYLISDTNFEFGIGIGYANSELYNYYSSTPDEVITTTIAPYLKKYFPINDKFAFHLIGEVGFSKTYLETQSSSNEMDVKQVGIVFRPGFVYFLTKKIALTANMGSMGYISTKSKYATTADTKSESYGFNFNASNMLIGLAYYL